MIFRTYILSTTYVHAQNMENKMSADERGNQTQLLFSSVGNAASRSVVITVGLGIPFCSLGWEKNVEMTTVLGGWTKFCGGCHLRPKCPHVQQRCHTDKNRSLPKEPHVNLKHQKFHPDKNRRLPGSKRHRFYKQHLITGHLVLNKNYFQLHNTTQNT